MPGGKAQELGSWRVGGYLVEYEGGFTPDTDFGPMTRSVALYAHGRDPGMGFRSLDEAARLDRSKAGVWIEAELKKRDAYEEKLMDLVRAGKLRWSSGTPAHLAATEGGTIARWPLGLDASLMPTAEGKQAGLMAPEALELKHYFTYDVAPPVDQLRALNRLFRTR